MLWNYRYTAHMMHKKLKKRYTIYNIFGKAQEKFFMKENMVVIIDLNALLE